VFTQSTHIKELLLCKAHLSRTKGTLSPLTKERASVPEEASPVPEEASPVPELVEGTTGKSIITSTEDTKQNTTTHTRKGEKE
jgi:hypothetical protein